MAILKLVSLNVEIVKLAKLNVRGPNKQIRSIEITCLRMKYRKIMNVLHFIEFKTTNQKAP